MWLPDLRSRHFGYAVSPQAISNKKLLGSEHKKPPKMAAKLASLKTRIFENCVEINRMKYEWNEKGIGNRIRWENLGKDFNKVMLWKRQTLKVFYFLWTQTFIHSWYIHSKFGLPINHSWFTHPSLLVYPPTTLC